MKRKAAQLAVNKIKCGSPDTKRNNSAELTTDASHNLAKSSHIKSCVKTELLKECIVSLDKDNFTSSSLAQHAKKPGEKRVSSSREREEKTVSANRQKRKPETKWSDKESTSSSSEESHSEDENPAPKEQKNKKSMLH